MAARTSRVVTWWAEVPQWTKSACSWSTTTSRSVRAFAAVLSETAGSSWSLLSASGEDRSWPSRPCAPHLVLMDVHLPRLPASSAAAYHRPRGCARRAADVHVRAGRGRLSPAAGQQASRQGELTPERLRELWLAGAAG